MSLGLFERGSTEEQGVASNLGGGPWTCFPEKFYCCGGGTRSNLVIKSLEDKNNSNEIFQIGIFLKVKEDSFT